MNKMFQMIIDDGEHLYKITRPGKSAADIKKRWSGNGEFIKVTDVTEDYPIDERKVMSALIAANFGEAEQELIRHLLRAGYSNVIEE